MYVSFLFRNGGRGQIGDGDRLGSLSAKVVPSLPRIKHVAAGADHSLALDGEFSSF